MRRNSRIVSNAAGNGSVCRVLFSSTYVLNPFPPTVIHKRVCRFCDQRAARTTGILPDMKIGGLCLFMFFVAFPSCEYGQSTAQIKGVIRGPQNAVMAGITVNLLSVERVRTTKTDESGKFEFTELPLNSFELQVKQAAGIKPVPVQEISFSEPSTRQFSIVLQLVAPECFPKIEPGYENRIGRTNLSGKIAKFSSSNTPLNNGRITATHIETGTTRVVNSNEKGDFEFVNLEPGKYTLKVSHQGYSGLAGIDFWITAENLTRLPTLYMFGKNDHSVILCQ